MSPFRVRYPMPASCLKASAITTLVLPGETLMVVDQQFQVAAEPRQIRAENV
ncbi:MAG: hypothetical protein KBA31_07255 [Alphaproteobacteria bacterium]|nr:hypothetical protein [Alphaproteobacteria bacterium]